MENGNDNNNNSNNNSNGAYKMNNLECDMCLSYGIDETDLEPVTHKSHESFNRYANTILPHARQLNFCTGCAYEIENDFRSPIDLFTTTTTTTTEQQQ
tara:strand:- start:195 stop:488 length:294 start_codon:yes stop_codon:yes gene_type:complete